MLYKKIFRDRLYVNSMWLIADSVVLTALGFVFWTVNAHLFSTVDVGLATALIGAARLIALFALLGLNVGLMRYLPTSKNRNVLINSSLAVSISLALISSFIFVVFLDFFSPELAAMKSTFFVLSFVLFVLFEVFYSFMSAIFIAEKKSHFVLIKDTIFSLLKLALPFALAFLGALGIFSSWLIALAVASITSLIFTNYKPNLRLENGLVKDIFRFSFANHIANFLCLAPGYVMPLIIARILGAEYAAYFYIAWMLSSLLNVIPHSVSKILLAEGSETGQIKSNIKKALLFTYTILVPATLVVLLASRIMLQIFGTEYVQNTVGFLRLLAIASIPLAVNIIYITILNIKHRIYSVVTINIIQALAFILSAAFGLRYGLIMVGVAWVGVHSLMAVYSLISIIRVMRHE